MQYLRNRLSERSTAAGIGALLTTAGAAVAGQMDMQTATTTAVLAILSMLFPTGGAAR
jgi:hypothetical protein